MSSKIRISLYEPGEVPPTNYFSLRLKKELNTERAEYKRPERLLVVSDIEGNFHALRKLLISNGVIDDIYQWTFGDGHLVILGDCFDRGEQVLECLWLVYSLEDRAIRKGGYVHFVLGNHEIMNMNGDWRYVHPRYVIKKKGGRPSTALYDGSSELWRWLHTKNIVERIGDILFVHGGIAEDLLQQHIPVTKINDLARKFYDRTYKPCSDPVFENILDSEHSPFWFRGYYQEQFPETYIDATLDQYGVKTIVTGHTVVPHVSTFFNGKVINVDTDHAAGNSEALFIENNTFYRVNMSGEKMIIKS